MGGYGAYAQKTQLFKRIVDKYFPCGVDNSDVSCYTAGRREALREYYGKMKHPGRKLAKIVLIAIALTVVNVALMFYLGFIHWA